MSAGASLMWGLVEEAAWGIRDQSTHARVRLGLLGLLVFVEWPHFCHF